MKPILLKFAAFGPYVNEQTIDFKRLVKSGIFLINGETGSGKTVILDAITFALYGKSSGGNRGDIKDMRCQLADFHTNTFVEYIFEVNNKEYKFERSLYPVKKRNGIIELTTKQNVSVLNSDGIFIPLFENPKLRNLEETAQRIIGLNYDQFRQVIILPQGQFERLLVAQSSEKEAILVSLFNADKWQKTAEYMISQLINEKHMLEYKKANYDRIFFDNNCANYDELKKHFDDMTKTLADKALLLKNKRSEYAAIQSQYDSLNELFLKFSKRDKILENLNISLKKSDIVDTYRIKLLTAKRANNIKPIFDSMKDSANTIKARNNAINQQEELSAKLEKKKAAATVLYNKILAKEPQIILKREMVLKYCNSIETYSKLNEADTKLTIAQNKYNEASTYIEKLANLVKVLSKEKQIIELNQADTFAEYTILYKRYINGISGVLASKLQANFPCPVCGSTTHPNLAMTTSEDIAQLIEQKNAQIEMIRTKLIEKTEELLVANNKYEQDKEKLAILLQTKESCTAIYDGLLKNTYKDIDSLKKLQITIEDLKIEIKQYETDVLSAKNDLDDINMQSSNVQTTLSLLKKEYTLEQKKYINIEKDFNIRLNECGFSDIQELTQNLLSNDQQLKIEQAIQDYDVFKKSLQNNLDELDKELAGKPVPDLVSIKAEKLELETTVISLANELAVYSNEHNKLTDIVKNLKNELIEYAALEKRVNDNLIFAKQIRGDKGVSLQRYVLGVLLSSITTAANQLLVNVHGGRYRLMRTIETTGTTHKAGLELQVFDSLSGENRSVISLSGGEKFLVALTLSIGLSTVVQTQAGGVKIDAMFIDEGFGTLDDDSISDALSILSSIKNSNGIVGIISHVQALKDSISTQICVTKNINGSNLHVVYDN